MNWALRAFWGLFMLGWICFVLWLRVLLGVSKSMYQDPPTWAFVIYFILGQPVFFGLVYLVKKLFIADPSAAKIEGHGQIPQGR